MACLTVPQAVAVSKPMKLRSAPVGLAPQPSIQARVFQNLQPACLHIHMLSNDKNTQLQMRWLATPEQSTIYAGIAMRFYKQYPNKQQLLLMQVQSLVFCSKDAAARLQGMRGGSSTDLGRRGRGQRTVPQQRLLQTWAAAVRLHSAET